MKVMPQAWIRRSLIALCAGALAMSLSACGNNDDNNTSGNNTSGNNTTATNNSTGGTNNTTGGTNNTTGGTNNTTGGTNNTTGGTNNTGGELTVDDAFAGVLDSFNQYACKLAWECPEREVQFALFAGRYADQETCVAQLDVFSRELELADIKASIMAGRQTFDAAKARTCLEKFKAGPLASVCTGPAPSEGFGFEEIPECQEVFVGTVAAGGGCTQSDDCAGDAYCDEAEDQCYGVCKPDGETCGEGTCGETQYCDYSGDAPVCVDNLALGSACTFDDTCADGSDCYYADEQAAEGVCTAYGSVQQGGACDFDEWCAAGLECGDDDTCEPVMAVAVKNSGEACSPFNGESICKAGLVCTELSISAAGATGTCGAPKPEDGVCYVFFECAPGLYCEGANLGNQTPGACKPLKAADVACDDDTECASFNCDGDVGKCVDPSNAQACMLP